MSNVKTITLTGEETEVKFDKPYAYIECNNLGNSEVLMSIKPNIIRGNDDVIIVKSGSSATIGDIGVPSLKSIYLKGSEEVQIIGKSFPQSSFKSIQKGGGIDVKTLLSRALWRETYNEGLYVDYRQWDTKIPQSIFEYSGITFVFKINIQALSSYYGLWGLHSSALGYMSQHDGNDANSMSISLPYHRGNIQDEALKVGNTIVYIVSDSADELFVMVDGNEIQMINNYYEKVSPYGNLVLMRSYTTSDRYFHGTIYDMMVFNFPLSRQEAIAVTAELQNR